MNENELLQLKQKIDKAITQINEFTGEQKGLLRELKNLGYNSIEEAEEGILKLEEEVTKLETRLEKQIINIKKLLE